MNERLETDRLDLRPFTPDDAEGWHAIWGDPQVIWWGENETFEESIRSLRGLLRAEAEDWPPGIGWLAIREKGREEIVGDVLLQPAPFVDGIEVGWHVVPRVWNLGYATEAARATVARAFARGHCDRVYAAIEERNGASLRVASKLGMHAVKDIEHAGLPHRLFVLTADRGGRRDAPAGA